MAYFCTVHKPKTFSSSRAVTTQNTTPGNLILIVFILNSYPIALYTKFADATVKTPILTSQLIQPNGTEGDLCWQAGLSPLQFRILFFPLYLPC